MNNKLYDVLENCIQALERGENLDSILARYPDLKDELRPVLEASLHARTFGGGDIPSDVQRRGRARLMQRASEMREAKRAPRRRMIPMFSRLAITFSVLGGFVLGSTGLVSAASASLPGDQLYPVKRTWEGVRLTLAFDPQSRSMLESQFEQERLDETSELITKRRSAPVSFAGLVTEEQNGQWMVSGISVAVTNNTRLPQNLVANGAPVKIIGTTNSEGEVEAEEIIVLQPGALLPPFEPSGDSDTGGETDNENHGTQAAPVVISTIIVPTSATPMVDKSSTPEPQSTPEVRLSYQFTGIVQSIQDNKWIINGQTVIVNPNVIYGSIKVGSEVNIAGYLDANGNFFVTKIEINSGGGSDNQNQNENKNKNENSTQNENDGSGGGNDNGSTAEGGG
jgi:hypothetical protein